MIVGYQKSTHPTRPLLPELSGRRCGADGADIESQPGRLSTISALTIPCERSLAATVERRRMHVDLQWQMWGKLAVLEPLLITLRSLPIWHSRPWLAHAIPLPCEIYLAIDAALSDDLTCSIHPRSPTLALQLQIMFLQNLELLHYIQAQACDR